MTIAIWIGAILFVVPGIIAALALWVAVPVAVVERPGVINSLKRSIELTNGYRWSILGLLVVASIVGAVVSYAASLLLDPTSPLPAAITSIVDGVTAAFSAIVAAVGYQQLRQAKEGVNVDQLAAVFA